MRMAWFFLLVFWATVAAATDETRLVSTAVADSSQPAGGNGPSVAPQITPDGRWVLLTSSANDLVTNTIRNFACNLFLHDRASNTTTLVSANLNGAGGNDDSLYGQVSTNGRYVVFQSSASDLVAGDTNGVSDIFVRDVIAGTNILASVASDGSPADGASTDPVITPDGRYVAFISAATNLTSDDTNNIPDIYLRDLVAGTTELISIGATSAVATVSAPVITPDGSYVAFYSTAKGLVAAVPAASQGEVYVRNRAFNTTFWASTNASGIVSNVLHLNNAPSYHPSISDDGKHITFKAGWTNGSEAPGGAGVPAVLIFQYDLAGNTASVVATNGFAVWQNCDDVYGPEASPDGRFVTFVATNKDANCLAIQLWDAQAGTNLNISVALDGSWPTNSISENPTVTADGRYVVFMSNATNLTTNIVSNGFHIFQRDTQTETTTLVDIDSESMGSANLVTTVPTMSCSGKLVAFESLDGNLKTNDNNQTFDVFVRDLNDGATELISQRGQPLTSPAGNLSSRLGVSSISADGHRMVFSSYANDLVTNDLNDNSDVFLADLQSGTTTLISVGMDGNAALGGDSITPAISADGHFVVFASAATNLVANDTNKAADIFLRNLDTGITTHINVNSNGVASGTGDASKPAISADGRYVVFLAKVTPTSAYPATFWKDTVGGRMATVNVISSLGPSISADGQRVLWFDPTPRCSVWNAPTLATIYTYANSISFAELSPTGSRLAYQAPSPKQLIVYNLDGHTNMFSCSDATAMKNTTAWSSDGRYLVFVTGAPLVADDSNGTNDVYLCDLQTGMVNLISANSNWTASANGISDSPSISADARFIVFRSFATNVIPGISNVPSLFVFDRTTGSNSLLATASAGGWTSFASLPIVSTNGNNVVFQSWNVAGITNDLNRVQNIFAAAQDSLIADSDADGIPDWWMLQYFGHANGEQSDSSRATDDADGDGLSNAQEYFCGTDPTNPNSVLALQIAPDTIGSNTASLTWPATPGKTYQVQYKDNLNGAAWTNYSGSISLIGRQGVISVSTSQTNRFFRAVCLD